MEPLAAEIIAATIESTHLPVSVKTRLGVKKIDTEGWMSFLLQQPLDAIILHGRIQKQMSNGDANWDEIAKTVKLRDQLAPDIPAFGNGDVITLDDAFERVEKYGVNGVMIGRGIFHNPWLYHPDKVEISINERLDTLLLHLQLYEKTWTGISLF